MARPQFPERSKPPWHLQRSQSRRRRSCGPLARRPQKPRLQNFGLLAGAEPAFKITVKNSANFYLIRAYPWLVPKGEIANPPAWTITFSRYGVPIGVEAAKTSVAEPIVAWVKETDQPYARITKKMVSGSRGAPHLTASGLRFAKLLTWPD